MNFQQTVILVAIIILILMLIIIGFSLARDRKKLNFPPTSSECPDYWISSENGCKNPENLGICGKGPISFDNFRYKGHHGDCNKAIWAKNCHVTWSGITNNDKLNKCR